MLDFKEAYSYVEQLDRFGSVLGLENIQALMNVLENPQDDIRIIHIAGTNGKGSVGAYLASMLKEAGLKVGRFCSPAVFDALECWQYDGRNMTEYEYAETVSQVKSACDTLALHPKTPIFPTRFEIETAMAFVYAKNMQVDVLLLETGMGGETDATNVVKAPLACVFTTISRDHMQFLGEDLESIASVKAGIIKPVAHVFSAKQDEKVQAVLDAKAKEVSKENSKKITYVDEDRIEVISQEAGKLKFSYKNEIYETSMSGVYQVKNAALAIEVFEKVYKVVTEMSRFQEEYSGGMLRETKQDGIKKGVANTTWPGRFEVIGQNPLFIIDGAHNEDAVKQLAITVENCFTNQPIDFIIGILADKEHEKMLKLMMPFANRIFTVTPPNKRGLDGKILAEEVRNWHEDVTFCETIEEAVEGALSHSKQSGCPILAFGSLSYLGKLKETYKQICESRV